MLVEEGRWLNVSHADHNAALVLRQQAQLTEQPGGPLGRRALAIARCARSSRSTAIRHSLPSAADRRALTIHTYPGMFSLALRCGLLAVRPPEVAAIVERARVQPVLAGRDPIRLATPAPVAAVDGAVSVGGTGSAIVLARQAGRLAGRGARWLGWWNGDGDVVAADSGDRVHVALRTLDAPAMARLAACLAVVGPADVAAAGGDHALAQGLAQWRALRGPLLADPQTASWVAAGLAPASPRGGGAARARRRGGRDGGRPVALAAVADAVGPGSARRARRRRRRRAGAW